MKSIVLWKYPVFWYKISVINALQISLLSYTHCADVHSIWPTFLKGAESKKLIRGGDYISWHISGHTHISRTYLLLWSEKHNNSTVTEHLK